MKTKTAITSFLAVSALLFSFVLVNSVQAQVTGSQVPLTKAPMISSPHPKDFRSFNYKFDQSVDFTVVSYSPDEVITWSVYEIQKDSKNVRVGSTKIENVGGTMPIMKSLAKFNARRISYSPVKSGSFYFMACSNLHPDKCQTSKEFKVKAAPVSVPMVNPSAVPVVPALNAVNNLVDTLNANVKAIIVVPEGSNVH